MSRIKTKDNEKNIKLFDRATDINRNMKAEYIKGKRKTERQIEENNGSAYEYADEILDDMVEETASSAETFAKKNFKKSVQKQRAIKSERQVRSIGHTMQSGNVSSSLPINQINEKNIVEKAKDRVIQNNAKAKIVGATTIKEKVIDFIKGGSTAAINTAKISVANTKAALVALFGVGSVGVFFVIIICVIGLVMGSSFGIFMATEDTGTGYTLNTVMQEINEEYFSEIERIKMEVPHDDFEISGDELNWKDILAVYAVKTTTAHEGVEVVTVDEKKAELIREVFWAMTDIVYETESYDETETIETTDEIGNVFKQEVVVKKIKLIIDVKNKTATEAAVLFKFEDNQKLLLKNLINNWQFNLISNIM